MKLYDGFDHALLGAVERCGSEPIAVYDHSMMVSMLCARDGMTLQDAHEYIEYNIIGGWIGDDTPWILTLRPQEILAYADQM